MKSLKKKWELCRLKSVPALTKFEVYDKLRSFTVQLGLTFTENRICFPQPPCYVQRAIYCSACCEELYGEGIAFADIVFMIRRGKHLHAVLRTGHTFHFIENRKIWYVYNSLDYGEPTKITQWWWNLIEWSTPLWWKRVHNKPLQ